MPRNYFPPTRRSRQRRRTFRIVLGILAVLAVVFVVFPTGLSTGKHPNQTADTTTTTVTVSHVARTYEAVLSQYQTALVAPNAAITGATDDIATQEGAPRTMPPATPATSQGPHVPATPSIPASTNPV